MIVRPRPPLWKLFFILKGSIILRILPQIFAVFLLSVLVVWAHRAFPGWVPAVNNGTALALLGIALSIFLGFRNNACYDRWWEARKIWGKLVYTTRGLGRQTLLLENVPGLEGGREKLLRYAIAFSQAMVSHLRPEETGGSNKYDKWLSAEERKALAESRNKPDFILRRLGAALADMRGKDALHPVDFQTLDSSVSALAEVQAACERLRFTPVPFGYTLLLHRTAYLFCFFIPFGFADMLGWGTPFATTLVAILSLGWMRWATSWRSRSEHYRTICPSGPSPIQSKSICGKHWVRKTCPTFLNLSIIFLCKKSPDWQGQPGRSVEEIRP